MCEGLAYAHEATGDHGELLHVVHRDISPPNVLISEHGEIKIVDFGLAKASTQLEKSEAGIIKGKFSYLAPEAAHGEEVDGAPTSSPSASSSGDAVRSSSVPGQERLRDGQAGPGCARPTHHQDMPEADDHLESILRRALARDREARYGTARAFGTDLTRYLYKLARP